jgi:hypothetical protein
MRYLLMMLVVSGCHQIDPDVEDRVTIQQGLYGQGASFDDTSSDSSYLKNLKISIYTALGSDADDVTFTDDHGFYQFARAAGDFVICADTNSFLICSKGVIRSGLQRADLEWDLGRFWYCRNDTRCPENFESLPQR